MEPRFNHMWVWDSFELGISISKPDKSTGWKLCFDLSIGFYYIWIYFISLKTKNNGRVKSSRNKN